MSNLSKTIKIAGNNIISKNILITSKPQSHMKLNRDIIAKKINSFDDSKNENKTSLKKKARSSSNLKQNEKNFILVHDSSGIQGGGLWCQAQKIYPNEKDTSYVSILPKLNSKPNLDAESYVDKKLIENLRIQIKDLTHKLSDKIAKYTDAEYRAERANNLKKIMEENLNTKEQELKTYRENNIQMKIEIESLNNALSNAKKEINRLQNELNEEYKKNKELNSKITNKEQFFSSDEINKLQKTISQLSSEKEGLKKLIESNNFSYSCGFTQEDCKQQLRDKDKILKTMEMTMNKALNENYHLKKKLTLEEQNKSQLNCIINKKNNLNEELKTQIRTMKVYFDNNLQEVKWNQNKINQKDLNIKIMKDKLIQKDEEIKKLNKKIEFLNKKLKIKCKNDNEIKIEEKKIEEKEKLIPVSPNPKLFGPDYQNYDYVDKELEKDIFGK